LAWYFDHPEGEQAGPSGGPAARRHREDAWFLGFDPAVIESRLGRGDGRFFDEVLGFCS